MKRATLIGRVRSGLAEFLFLLAGRLDDSYDVWLDHAPRRRRPKS